MTFFCKNMLPLFHLLLSLLAAAADSSVPSDAVSLLAFKSNADPDNKLLYTTNEGFNFCQWRGVECTQGSVVRYVVQSFGLRGTVSAGTLSRLNQLQVLSLKNNSLFGPLPDFSPLINLHTLFLDQNCFSGAFLPSLLSLRRLLILDLSRNNFTGLLPVNLTALDWLSYLRLDSNRFSGAIPPLNQTTLEIFNVSNNNLSGSVPVTPTLQKFNISLTSLAPSSPQNGDLVALLGFTTLNVLAGCVALWGAQWLVDRLETWVYSTMNQVHTLDT